MFLVGIAQSVREAEHTAFCEPTLYTMCDPLHLTNLYASTACYVDSFTFYICRRRSYLTENILTRLHGLFLL
jgi:hypothetical protein